MTTPFDEVVIAPVTHPRDCKDVGLKTSQRILFHAAEQTELDDFVPNKILSSPLIDEEAELLSGEVDELEGGASSRIVMNRSKATKSIIQKSKPKVV